MQTESPQLSDVSKQSNRLEVEPRNRLQVEIMRKLGLSSAEQVQWVDEYGRRVSDIIDSQNETGENIRKLVRQGKIEQAAEIVIKILSLNN